MTPSSSSPSSSSSPPATPSSGRPCSARSGRGCARRSGSRGRPGRCRRACGISPRRETTPRWSRARSRAVRRGRCSRGSRRGTGVRLVPRGRRQHRRRGVARERLSRPPEPAAGRAVRAERHVNRRTVGVHSPPNHEALAVTSGDGARARRESGLASDEVAMSDTLYKVIVAGRSCHGGDLAWSLPTPDGQGGYVPGDWHTVKGEIAICKRGLHLTTARYQAWWQWDAELYEAETREIVGWDGDKCVCRSARLLRPVPPPDWWTRAQRAVADISRGPWRTSRACRGSRGAGRSIRRGTSSRAGRCRGRSDGRSTLHCRLPRCADLPLDPRHRDHAAARWAVGRRGMACSAMSAACCTSTSGP